MPSNIYWNQVTPPSFSSASNMMQQAGENINAGLKGFSDIADSFHKAEIAKAQATSDTAESNALALAMQQTDPNKVRTADYSQFLPNMTPQARMDFADRQNKIASGMSTDISNIAAANIKNAKAEQTRINALNLSDLPQSVARNMQPVYDLLDQHKITPDNREFYKHSLSNYVDNNGKSIFATQAEKDAWEKEYDHVVDSSINIQKSEEPGYNLMSDAVLNHVYKVTGLQGLKNVRDQMKITQDNGLIASADLDPSPDVTAQQTAEFRKNIDSLSTSNPAAVRSLNVLASGSANSDIIKKAKALLDESGLEQTNKAEYQRELDRLNRGDVPMGILNAAFFNTGTTKYGWRDPLHGIGETADYTDFINKAASGYLKTLGVQGNQLYQAQRYKELNGNIDMIEKDVTGIIKNITRKDFKHLPRSPSEANFAAPLLLADKVLSPDEVSSLLKTYNEGKQSEISTDEGTAGGKLYLNAKHYAAYMKDHPDAKNVVNTEAEGQLYKSQAQASQDTAKKIIDTANPQSQDTTAQPNQPVADPIKTKSDQVVGSNQNVIPTTPSQAASKITQTDSADNTQKTDWSDPRSYYQMPEPISNLPQPTTPPKYTGKYITPHGEAETYLMANDYKLTPHARGYLKSGMTFDGKGAGQIQLYKDADTGDLYSTPDLKPSSLVGTKSGTLGLNNLGNMGKLVDGDVSTTRDNFPIGLIAATSMAKLNLLRLAHFNKYKSKIKINVVHRRK